MYSIYEIKGVKIGCTRSDEFKTRQRNQRKKGKMTVLEEHTCIYKASDRERELQSEKGYRVDTVPYWYVTTKMLERSRAPEVVAKRESKKDKAYYERRTKNTDYTARNNPLRNQKAQAHRQTPIVGISPEGKILKFKGIGAAARKLTKQTGIYFERINIASCVNPKQSQKTHRGYTFKHA